MAMDSIVLQEALIADPVTSCVLEEHEVSPSVLQFLTFEAATDQKDSVTVLGVADGLIRIGLKKSYECDDPAELAHRLAHVFQDEGERKPEVFAFSESDLKALDTEFLKSKQHTLQEYRRFLPLYEGQFAEPKIARKYFDKLFKTAQQKVAKHKLHQLSFNKEEQQILNMLRTCAVKMKVRLYVVGGCIRDKLLGEENNDLDFMVVTDNLDEFVGYVAQTYQLRDPVKLERSQAYTLRVGAIDVDIIDARRVYAPMERADIDSLEEEDDWSIALDDIFRRDLTINAIAYDVVGNKVLDPTRRGFSDLQKGIINTIIDPYVKYRINAFDMLRALRFAAVYDFALGNDMLPAMKSNAHRLTPRNLGGDISNRRILRELRKAAETADTWYRMKKFLAEVGLVDNLAEDIEKVEVQRTSLSGGEEEDG